MKINAIILAAGQGTRMRSSRAKVLHNIGGKPMLAHVINAASVLDYEKLLIVYGHDGEQVKSAFDGVAATWIHQEQQLGTGHAVAEAMAAIDDDVIVLVLYGDTPLILGSTLGALLEGCAGGLGLLTTVLDRPEGYGRIIRDASGAVQAIVEDKDATVEERHINEINTGILAVPAKHLRRWLAQLENKNAQGEYYLTDIIAMAVSDGVTIKPLVCTDPDEVMGINDRLQQAAAERVYQERVVQQLMQTGVTMIRPETVTVNGELTCGSDVVIEPNVIFNGKVKIENDVTIGAFSVISNCAIGSGVEVLPHCVMDDAVVGNACRIGPFARIRPETTLAEQVHVGNFVEIKKSTIAQQSKINHLSYIGDAVIGAGVNIGAGTITCNYDGANKYQTRIEDNAFIGSDTQLVAPVTVGAGATIGAGSTITRDVDSDVLALTRVAQKMIKNWQRPKKKG